MFGEYKNLFFIYSLGLSSICFLSFFAYYVTSKFSLIISKKNSFYIFVFSLLFYSLSIFYLSFGKINALHHYIDFSTVLEIYGETTKVTVSQL